MIYRTNPKNGELLSQLGFGCMRLPRAGAGIDMAKARTLIERAVEHGVNYFDAAYIYPGAEAALGAALAGGLRGKVNIATKLPTFIMKNSDGFDYYFNKSLERLQTDVVDYLMLHMLTGHEQFEKFLSLGFDEWARRKKAGGQVRNMGFSFHGSAVQFKKLVDAYDWDFCMIQYNYIDEQYQAGREGLLYAQSKGLPVMVMEPLRGGKLVNRLPFAAAEAFRLADANKTPAEWGLRWVWNHPEVTLLLSGMSTEAQLDANVAAADGARPETLTEREFEAYAKALAAIRKATKVNCTGCGYCMPCPAGVNIPSCFDFYNELALSGTVGTVGRYVLHEGVNARETGYASQCVGCGKCEAHCPQSIPIREKLAEARRALEPFWAKPIGKIARRMTQSK